MHDQEEQEMSNLSLWLAAPRFDEDDRKREKANLTCEEIVELATDLYHGVGCSSRNRSARSLFNSDVSRVDDELDSIPAELKESLLEAQHRCPELVGDEEKLLFLKCEPSLDVSMAAENMCRYWKKRREIFGDDKAFLPLTTDGALKDNQYLSTCPLLPVEFDQADRIVLLQDLKDYDPDKHTRDDVVRAMWYFYEAYMPIMDDPRTGAVLILRSSAPRIDEDYMDMKLCKQLMEIQDAVPLDFKAYHMLKPPLHVRFVMPALRAMMGRRRRQRFVMHQGTNDTVLESIGKYGIPTDDVPLINEMDRTEKWSHCVEMIADFHLVSAV